MSMEHILSSILKLEDEAKEIVKRQTDRRDALPVELDRRLEEMRREYLAKAENRIAALRSEEAERLQAELSQVEKKHELQMARLSQVSKRETERFADEIFNRVIKAEL